MRTTKPARIFAVGVVVVGLGPLILGVGPAAADSHGRGGSHHQARVGGRPTGVSPSNARSGPSGSTVHVGSGHHHHLHLTADERNCLEAQHVTLMAGRPHRHARLDAATRAAFRAALVACDVIPAAPVVVDTPRADESEPGSTLPTTTTAVKGPVTAN